MLGVEIGSLLKGGAIEIFGTFADLGNFWFGFFRFSHLETAVFRFWSLVKFPCFLQFILWFSVLSTIMAVFQIFFVECSLRFFWFCQGRYIL